MPSVSSKASHRRGQVMRAKLPSKDGFVERDGVRIHYEVYGQGGQTMVFLPPWSIVHSRVYKAQLPYFSERFRCIAFDARGNGRSDRPDDVAAYSLANCVRSEEHTSELQSRQYLVCRLLLEKKKKQKTHTYTAHDCYAARTTVVN